MDSRSRRRQLWSKLAVAVVFSAPVALFAACDVVFATNRDTGWDFRMGNPAIDLAVKTTAKASKTNS